MNILVAGGTGYIGSHVCVCLLEAGHGVVIADNLSNSKESVVGQIEKITGVKPKFYKADASSAEALDKIFEENKIDGIMHFAGFKAVGESEKIPLDYYQNNLNCTIALAKACLKHKVNRFVFSSSATVYGDQPSPYRESARLQTPSSPYGKTKLMSEMILADAAATNKEFGVMLLRYFNPVGAHESGLIGESPNGIPNNLMPYIQQVARGKLPKLNVFGGDYETADGTCERDYIHVCDLALGHLAALEKTASGVSVYNLGCGRPLSVLTIVKTFEKANGIKIPYVIADRRAGDLPSFYADPTKAERELGWKAARSVEDMCRDAWNFEKKFSEQNQNR